MVLCKFFLQGTCRFGESCKFEHQVNSDHSYANPTSILLQNYNKPAPQQQQQTTTNVDTNTLVKSVINDMTTAEKGGQWLLSSYAPFKEKPAFPGFEDHSMEEIRYLFYESVKNGTVEQFKQNLQMTLQQAVMKIKALQNPSPDTVNLLKSIYNSPPSSSFSNNQSFNATQTNSTFGNQQPQQHNIFGGAPPNQSVFTPSITPSNIFTSNQPSQAQQNIFRSSTNPIFGGGQTSSNIFPKQQTPNQSKSIFANSQPTTANPVFASNSIFSGNQQVFPNQPPQFTQTSPFNQKTPTFVTPPQSIFQQQSPNQFIPQVPNPNQFSNQQPITCENKSSLQHSTNIFGNIIPQPNNPIFGGSIPPQQKPNDDFYSKMEELTEDEIKWFQSDDLDVSKIPEKPPTYEMCFKVQ